MDKNDFGSKVPNNYTTVTLNGATLNFGTLTSNGEVIFKVQHQHTGSSGYSIQLQEVGSWPSGHPFDMDPTSDTMASGNNKKETFDIKCERTDSTPAGTYTVTARFSNNNSHSDHSFKLTCIIGAAAPFATIDSFTLMDADTDTPETDYNPST